MIYLTTEDVAWHDDESGITWTTPPPKEFARIIKAKNAEIVRLRIALAEANNESLFVHAMRCLGFDR